MVVSEVDDDAIQWQENTATTVLQVGNKKLAVAERDAFRGQSMSIC